MRIPLWLRLFFLFVVLQALLVGSALFDPTLISLVLPWPASPLNARFIAALYLMGAISAALCMCAGSYAAVRISLIEIGVVTGGLLLITVPHFGEFAADRFPYRWTIFYTIDPLAAAAIAWTYRRRDPPPGPANRYRALFGAYAAVLGVAGVVLLFLPSVAVGLWPWALPPILGQVYSIYFLTFAVGALLSAAEARWVGIWIYCAANLGLLVLVIIVSLLHRERFASGPSTWIWFALCTLGLVGFGRLLLSHSKHLRRREVAA